MNLQKVGRSEPFFVLQVIGDDRLAGPQSVTRGELEICANTCHIDEARVPADARPHEHPVVFRNVFQDLAQLGLKTLGGELNGTVQ